MLLAYIVQSTVTEDSVRIFGMGERFMAEIGFGCDGEKDICSPFDVSVLSCVVMGKDRRAVPGLSSICAVTKLANSS
jgi:hypothetical protein